jgi:hypothetical protein
MEPPEQDYRWISLMRFAVQGGRGFAHQTFYTFDDIIESRKRDGLEATRPSWPMSSCRPGRVSFSTGN